MPLAQIAASHYEPDHIGDGHKDCINYYAEKNPQDPARPFRLMTTPGSRVIEDDLTAARGIFHADGFAGGKLVFADDDGLRTLDTSAETFGTITGTLPGSDRVQAVFSEVQAGFLADGDLLVSSNGTSFAAVSDADWATLLSDHGQTAFTSITTLGQRLIASYGSRFGFSETLEFNDTTTLSFYTAESAPDGVVAVYTLGTYLIVFGSQTIETWVQTGLNDDPFRPISTEVITRGCVARDSIVLLDNSLFFIADDRTVRRINGLTPVLVNKDDSWVTRLLEDTDPSDMICYGIETDAHTFYVIRLPNACVVYDIATQTWHRRQSQGSETWDWQFCKRVGAKHYAAGAGAEIVELSRDYASDKQADANTFGTEIIRQFTAHLPVMEGRPAIKSVRLEGSKGVGLSSGQGADAGVAMAKSIDKGITYGPSRTRSLGKRGDYTARTIWHRFGRAAPEQTVFKTIVSDPVKHSITSVAVNTV